MSGRILVAMSGGVDSSVVAALLKREGRDLLGVTLQLNPCEDRHLGRSCCGVDAVLAARRVADQLEIPHTVLDCRREFEAAVLAPAWREYKAGRTPSPCIACNQKIKFGYLLEKARSFGASTIATGHYARIVDGALHRGSDRAKDQAYFLFGLTPGQLAATHLPLGAWTKPQIRALAREWGLATAERSDSQDACLGTGADGFAEALRERFDDEMPDGEIVDETGAVVGRHRGLHRYTLGQRRGLGGLLPGRRFVAALDGERNRVRVTSEPAALMGRDVTIRLLPHFAASAPERADIQIRSRHLPATAERISHEGDLARYRFEVPQRAITPGQAAVLFRGDEVVSGGWIE